MVITIAIIARASHRPAPSNRTWMLCVYNLFFGLHGSDCLFVVCVFASATFLQGKESQWKVQGTMLALETRD